MNGDGKVLLFNDCMLCVQICQLVIKSGQVMERRSFSHERAPSLHRRQRQKTHAKRLATADSVHNRSVQPFGIHASEQAFKQSRVESFGPLLAGGLHGEVWHRLHPQLLGVFTDREPMPFSPDRESLPPGRELRIWPSMPVTICRK
jgi:hypothetical protein